MLESEDIKGSEIEIPEGLTCPRCRSPLYPITSPDRVTFQCNSSHYFTCEELLTVHSDPFVRGLEALLAGWENMLWAMSQTACHASRNGYLSVAEIFDRQVRQIAKRVEFIRSAIAKTQGQGSDTRMIPSRSRGA